MMTPFEIGYSERLVKKIARKGQKKAIRNINKYFRNRFWKILFRKSKKVNIGIKDACIIWTYACIFDDIAYNCDYSRYCNGYSDKYKKARDKIKEEFDKKKGLSRKYVYNHVKILNKIIDGLKEVAAIPSDVNSELMKQMNRISRTDGNALRKDLMSLSSNLSRWRNTFNK